MYQLPGSTRLEKTGAKPIKSRVRREKLVQWFSDMCKDCRYRFPSYIYEFHHRDPSTNGIALQAQDELLKRICTKAEQIHDKKGILPVHVAIHFDHGFRLGKKHVTGLSNWIVEYIKNRTPFIGEIVQEEKFVHPSCDFPEAIWRIQIIGLSEEEKSVFWSPHAISVLDIKPDKIQRTLDKKKALFQSYQAQAEEVWLLIPYEIGKPSTVFDPYETSKDCNYESPFQKVFLMNCFMRSFSEISIKQPRKA